MKLKNMFNLKEIIIVISRSRDGTGTVPVRTVTRSPERIHNICEGNSLVGLASRADEQRWMYRFARTLTITHILEEELTE